ncbi:MAG: septum formation initiator family protein [Clostridia bacterium]|nr:septum formation initiator family protein [Clostridia bacterium]
MKNKALKNKIKYKITPKLAIAFGVVCACFIAVVLIGQAQRQAEIDSEMAQLEAEYQLLYNEKQRLENMVDYVQSEDYLLQYAREKLGFVKPDDIKFDIDE